MVSKMDIETRETTYTTYWMVIQAYPDRSGAMPILHICYIGQDEGKARSVAEKLAKKHAVEIRGTMKLGFFGANVYHSTGDNASWYMVKEHCQRTTVKAS
jgi:hypothetical protein